MSAIPLRNFPPLSPQPLLVVFPPVSGANQFPFPQGAKPPLPFPELPKPPAPQKPNLDPRMYPRPDVDKNYKLYNPDEEEIDLKSNASYKDIYDNLIYLGANTKQLNIWANTFNKLDENDLPTYEFSKGFIKLLKVNATDIALQTYAVGAEQIATKHSGKRSLKKLIDKCLDIVQRPNLTETQRESLLIKSVYSLLRKDGISFRSFMKLLTAAISLLAKLL